MCIYIYIYIYICVCVGHIFMYVLCVCLSSFNDVRLPGWARATSHTLHAAIHCINQILQHTGAFSNGLALDPHNFSMILWDWFLVLDLKNKLGKSSFLSASVFCEVQFAGTKVCNIMNIQGPKHGISYQKQDCSIWLLLGQDLMQNLATLSALPMGKALGSLTSDIWS